MTRPQYWRARNTCLLGASRGWTTAVLLLGALVPTPCCGEEESYIYSEFAEVRGEPSFAWAPFPFSAHHRERDSWQWSRGGWYQDEPDWYCLVQIYAGGDGKPVRVNRGGESWMDFVSFEIQDKARELSIVQIGGPGGAEVKWIDTLTEDGPKTVHDRSAIEEVTGSRLSGVFGFSPSAIRTAWGELEPGDYRIRFTYDSRKTRFLTRAHARTSWISVSVRRATTDDDRLNLRMREANRVSVFGHPERAVEIYRELVREKPASLLIRHRLWLELEVQGREAERRKDLQAALTYDRAALDAVKEIVPMWHAHMSGTRVDPDFYPPEVVNRKYSRPDQSLGPSLTPTEGEEYLTRKIAEIEEKLRQHGQGAGGGN